MVLKEKDIHILEIGDLENGITQILTKFGKDDIYYHIRYRLDKPLNEERFTFCNKCGAISDKQLSEGKCEYCMGNAEHTLRYTDIKDLIAETMKMVKQGSFSLKVSLWNGDEHLYKK